VKFLKRLIAQSVETLTRVACVLALAGLLFLVISVVVPGPLPVVIAMGVGHGIGILACACYLLAIVIDTSKRDRVAAVTTTPPKGDDQRKTDA